MEAVQKLKDLVGVTGGTQEKPEPAPAANLTAEKDAEQNIHDDAAAAAGPPAEGPGGREPLDEAEIEQMLFDECLGAQTYTYEEFLEAIDQPEEERGDTPDEKKHWSYPRRWKVVLWNLQIQNYMDDRLSAFIEFEFGGTREECKVRKGNTSRVYAKGKDKNYLRTPVASDVTSAQPVDMHFRKAFEYRGSYLDLEREKLKVKVWEYKNWTLNHLEAIFEEALLGFATGGTHVERDLYKFVKGRRSRRCRISFHLYFQELYDFEFSFLKWRLLQINSTTTLQNRVMGRVKKKSLLPARSKVGVMGTRSLMDHAKYAMQQRKVKKEMNRRLSQDFLSGTTGISRKFTEYQTHSRRELSRLEGIDQGGDGEATGEGGQSSSRGRSATHLADVSHGAANYQQQIDELEGKRNLVTFDKRSGGASMRTPRAVLFNLQKNQSVSSANLTKTGSRTGVAEALALAQRAARGDATGNLADGLGGETSIDNILLFHQTTLLLTDESPDMPNTASNFVGTGFRKGARCRLKDAAAAALGEKDANLALPTVRLSISLYHASAMNKGMSIVSAELPQTLAPKWDNLGEVYFRGTLRDLDSTYLQISVEDMSAPRVVRQIGYGELPLRGVVDYPFMRTELLAPTWLSLQAKVERWSEELEQWRFGFVEGSVKVAHIPRYRQMGDVYEADSSRIFLVIRIKDVDQIVTPDNRPVVDSYVEASFDGTSRRTRVVRQTLNPVWDDEITIPLRLPPARDVTVPHITRKGKVWLDVWGIGMGYVDHLGGCNFSLYDIFFNEKHSRRGLVQKDRIDLESNTKQMYETRVLSTRRRLSFIHKDDRPSNIQFDAWTCPDILEVTGLEKLPMPEPYSITSTFPEVLQVTYSSLQKMWNEVIEAKKLLDSDTGVGPPRFFHFEYPDQRKETRFLPTTMTRIKPPCGIESESAVFHYIRCVPFAIKRENLIYTPDFTMQLKAGNALDHSILMASLLAGLPAYAFVCIGTLWDKQLHSWVASFHYDTEKECALLKFWETTTGVVYTMKNRFYRPHILLKYRDDPDVGVLQMLKRQRKERLEVLGYNVPDEEDKDEDDEGDKERKAITVPVGGAKLPYRSIDVMFNERNVWMNIQDANPSRIWYDLWRMDMWYPFSPGSHDLRPCFITRGFGAKLAEWQFERATQDIRDKVLQDITTFRASRNLPTRWNRDDLLEAFLQTGLELLHQAATAREDYYQLAKLKLEDWKKAMYYKVPSSYRVRGAPMHFNTIDSKTISDSIIRNVDFVECRDRTASFCLGVVLFNLPGELVSTYVYTCLTQKVTERERRRILAQKEKASREEAQRKARRKQTKPADAPVGIGGNDDPTDKREETAAEASAVAAAKDSAATAETVDAAPEILGEIEHNEEKNGTTSTQKKKKRVVRKGNVPKVKKRPYKMIEGAESAAIVIARDYYKEQEAPDFKQLMRDFETHITDALGIQPGRVHAYQARYAEKKILFGISPHPPDGEAPVQSSAALMALLGPLLAERATSDENFETLTGGLATLEWGGPGSDAAELLKIEKQGKLNEEEYEKEAQVNIIEKMAIDGTAVAEADKQLFESDAAKADKLKKKKKRKKDKIHPVAEVSGSDKDKELTALEAQRGEMTSKEAPTGLLAEGVEGVAALAASPVIAEANLIVDVPEKKRKKKKKGTESSYHGKKGKKASEDEGSAEKRETHEYHDVALSKLAGLQSADDFRQAEASSSLSSSADDSRKLLKKQRGLRVGPVLWAAAAAVKFRRGTGRTSASTESGRPEPAASSMKETVSSSSFSSLSSDTDVMKLKTEIELVRARLQADIEQEASLSDDMNFETTSSSEVESIHSFASSDMDDDETSSSSEASWSRMQEVLRARHSRLQELIGNVKHSYKQLTEQEAFGRKQARNVLEVQRREVENMAKHPRAPSCGIPGDYTFVRPQPPSAAQGYTDGPMAKHYIRMSQQPSANVLTTTDAKGSPLSWSGWEDE